MSRRQTNQRPRKASSTVAVAMVGVVLLLCFLMAFGAILAGLGSRNQGQQAASTPQAESRNAGLTIAYSPEKAVLLKGLAEKFNAKNLRTSDRQAMKIDLVELKPDEMVETGAGRSGDLPGDDPRLVAVARPVEQPLRAGAADRAGQHSAAARRRGCALRGHAHRDRGLGEQRQEPRLARQTCGLVCAPDARPAGSELQVEPSEHGARQRPVGDVGRVLRRRGRAAWPHRSDGAEPQDARIRQCDREDRALLRRGRAAGDPAGGAGRPEIPGCLRDA